MGPMGPPLCVPCLPKVMVAHTPGSQQCVYFMLRAEGEGGSEAGPGSGERVRPSAGIWTDEEVW